MAGRTTHLALGAFLLLMAADVACVLAQAQVPRLSGRVVDQADVLSSSTEGTLSDLLAAHEDSTGNQIVVLTVPSLDGEAIEEFALRAGREWEIGTEEHDNGILLVVAPNERKVRIEVGYGLEGAVPDAVAAQIIRREIIPEFRDGDFDGGVSAGTFALLEAVAGEYEAESGGGGGPPPLAVRIVLSVAFGFVLLFSGFGLLMAGAAVRRIVSIFLLPVAFAAGGLLTLSMWGGFATMFLFAGAIIALADRPGIKDLRKRMKEAAKADKPTPVAVGPFTMHVGGPSRSSSSSFGGSSGFSGGGFSGGGGSFGGGGASGGW